MKYLLFKELWRHFSHRTFTGPLLAITSFEASYGRFRFKKIQMPNQKSQCHDVKTKENLIKIINGISLRILSTFLGEIPDVIIKSDRLGAHLISSADYPLVFRSFVNETKRNTSIDTQIVSGFILGSSEIERERRSICQKNWQCPVVQRNPVSIWYCQSIQAFIS